MCKSSLAVHSTCVNTTLQLAVYRLDKSVVSFERCEKDFDASHGSRYSSEHSNICCESLYSDDATTCNNILIKNNHSDWRCIHHSTHSYTSRRRRQEEQGKKWQWRLQRTSLCTMYPSNLLTIHSSRKSRTCHSSYLSPFPFPLVHTTTALSCVKQAMSQALDCGPTW